MSEQSSPQKIAVITGGSRGIGRSMVVSLAKRDVHCIFTYHKAGAKAEEVVNEAKQAGAGATALQLDAGEIASFGKFAEQTKETLLKLGTERFDYLVNNAANNHRNMPFEAATEEELDLMYTVHYKGVFLLTQKLLPLMNDGGRIINISSGRTRIALPGGSAYASMKGAVEVLTKHMAKELGPRGIAVNVVAPGAIATDFSGGVVRDNPQVNRHIAGMTALGRAGVPDDIGPMIASLLSEENRWINAQRIEVSGGMVI